MIAPRQFAPVAAALLLLPGLEARPAPQESPAVVLDLVVRDKKGVAVSDLVAAEIEVYQDGTRQTFAGLHRGADDAGPRLVVLLFPRLPHEERVLAQAAAEEFIKKQLGPGVSAAVMNIGTEIVPVQDFTADASALKAAVKRALDDNAKAGYPNAQVLFALVDRLKDQPGRKTVVLFSAGLALPVGVEGVVDTLAGAANHYRISFYGIDPRGLELSRGEMSATRDSPGVETEVWNMGGGSKVNEDLRGYGVNVGKDVPDALPQALAKLAAATGGFAAERTNNFSKPMRAIAEDARGYYELTYTPTGPWTEGGLRQTEVKVAREGATVQARRSYLVGEATLPVPAFEKRLAAALTSEPLARDVEVWDRVLHYAWDGREVTHVVWVAVPLARVALTPDASAGKFKGDVSVLARVKDASGKVVATFSRPYPLEGPLDMLPRAHSRSIPFVRRVKLAPGEYTLETAVRDESADKVTARRTPFKTEAPAGVALSTLSLCDLVPATDTDADDPLRIGNQLLVPNIGQPIKAGQPAMTLYSVVYPVAGSKDPAQMKITVMLGDQPANAASATLPAPDARGWIPYATALRMDVLPPGPYRIKVEVAQGSSRAEESLAFTIVP